MRAADYYPRVNADRRWNNKARDASAEAQTKPRNSKVSLLVFGPKCLQGFGDLKSLSLVLH